jgi:signal transduction histidine kinase/DNA-binding response OmpR family regulator
MGQDSFSGLPAIINYSSSDYNSIDQNWTVLQDSRGTMFFGNSNGVLSFDGNTWMATSTSSYNGVCRSLAKNKKGTIYSGSINSFGLLETNSNGKIVFRQLSDQLPSGRQSFNDIWEIACSEDKVFFMSNQSVFIYQNDKLINIIDARNNFTFITAINGKVYIHDSGAGLSIWNNGSFEPLAGRGFFKKQKLVFLIPLEKDKLLAGTANQGIFLLHDGKAEPWGPEISASVFQDKLSCGVELFDHSFAFGTIQSGIFFVNRMGSITNKLSSKEGLIGNMITALFCDRDKNLWATTTSGISFAEINSPFRYFNDPYGLKQKMILSSGYFNNRLFLAGTDAVYYLPYAEQKQNYNLQTPSIIDKSMGQSWQLKVDDKQLYIAHNPGILIIENDFVQRHILKESNVYSICFPLKAPDKFIASIDNGLVVVNKKHLDYRKILDFKESPRYMEFDTEGSLWVITETLNGVYRITFNQKFDSVLNCEFFNTFNGLPDQSVLSIISGKQALWVLTEKGLFRFNPDSEKFEYDSLMNTYPVKGATLANTDVYGNIWLGGFNYLALLKSSGDKGFSPVDTVFRRLGNHSIYHGAILPDSTWVLSGSSGIIHYNPRIPFRPLAFNTQITQVSPITSDSSKYHDGAFPYNSQFLGWLQGDDNIPEIPYKENSLKFVCASGCFIDPQKAVFHYSLTLEDAKELSWSEWTTRNVKEYTNLHEGKYIFKVVSRNIYGIESIEATYRFIILPPWYRTRLAFISYVFMVLFMFLITIKWNTRRLEKKSIQLEKIVKERTNEIQLQKEEIEIQKGKIEEQNEKIILDRDNLEIMATQLKELDDFKSRFFTNISHELKTPLTLIISPLEQLEQNADDDRLKQYYTLMLRNARRLLNLINQLLDLSKLEKGIIRLTPEYAEISSFIRNVVNGFSDFAIEKKISLLYTETSDELWIHFDKDILEKILDNLISNALKYTGQGGAITIKLSVSDAADWVQIIVKDTGEGIPEEHLERIFDRFYQATAVDGRKKDGFGIGLSFVKELTEIHHGHISVKSSITGGTEFKVLLPLKLTFESSIQQPMQANEEVNTLLIENSKATKPDETISSHKTRERLTILIVEDNKDAMEFIAGNLTENYQVLRAEDGLSGLDIASESLPDLIVTDVMMPRMDGIEMTRRIRLNRNSSHIPVIMLTAKSSIESRLEGLEARADDYIAKPFNMRELQARIANLIALRAELRREYRDELNINPAEVTSNSLDASFLEKAIRLVEENMAQENFSIEHLYQELAMSRSMLHKKLKALTNQSASEFINDIRLRNAARLLKNQTSNISEIAYSVGYNSISYFNISFKKKFGVTPTEYKE